VTLHLRQLGSFCEMPFLVITIKGCVGYEDNATLNSKAHLPRMLSSWRHIRKQGCVNESGEAIPMLPPALPRAVRIRKDALQNCC